MAPDNALQDLTAVNYFIAAAAFVVLAALALVPWRKRPGSFWVAGASLLSVVWALYLGVVALDSPLTPLSGGPFEVLRNAGWFALLLAMLTGRFDEAGRLFGPLRTVTVSIMVFLALALVLLAVPAAPILGAWPAVAVLAMAVLGLVLVEQAYRNTPPQRRWEIKFLALGLGAVFAFDLFLFADLVLFQAVDGPAWQARGLVNAIVVPLIAVSLARRPLQREAPTVSRQLLFHTAALTGAGFYLLAVGAAGYYLRHVGGELGPLLQVTFLFGAVVLLAVIVTSGSFRARLRVFLSKHFFRYSFDYRQEWLRFTGTLSAEDGELPLRQRAILAIGELVESPGGLLWVRDRDGSYRLDGVLNLGDPDYAPEPPESDLVEFLARTGWVIDLDEYRRQPEVYQQPQWPDWLVDNPRHWTVVPLLKGDFLQGFVVLARPRAPRKIEWEERDLLKTAGRQLAVYVALVQTDAALLEARQFEAFHRLAAFLVHDLKNVSAQLSLVCSNAERHADNPEFVRDAFRTVANARERLERTQLQLRQARPAPLVVPRAVDLVALLQEVIRSSGDLLPVPQLDAPEVLMVQVDSDGLRNVLLHLVRNAQEATDDHGSITLTLYPEGSWAMVLVQDNGHGMDSEFMKNRLFRPFQTTKGNAGMGIGLYEARERIMAMGGRIDVESTPGVGTLFTLRLPLAGVDGSVSPT
ncbi:XrtA/PEP-CTERM system histidine kinase PrsK [Thioalkalivibrio sp. ALJT]|uniref:XrtA/PEP-CTERM system histidine kinase PrsK n=1 Tax=Thioalkalivibrio sp. ALJT TaxID=1158146 RepID=UPI0003801314|nr:XrtA/PEP-CTERM system histidine kinase PrsK [Thioalkalivibrio sp. ALJT]